MSVFTERPATALLVVDVQVDAMQGVWGRAEIIDRIAVLIEAARSKGVPVIWIRHSDEWLPHGSDEWQIVPELLPAQDEAIVEKCFGDSFEATDLEEVLGAGKVGHIVVCGAQSDACIISTLYGGFVRGYNVTLVRDAHTTPHPIDQSVAVSIPRLSFKPSIASGRAARRRTGMRGSCARPH